MTKKFKQAERDFTKELLSIDLDECFKYAEKYSEKEYEEMLKHMLDGYMIEGVYLHKFDSVEFGIQSYLRKEFDSKLDAIADAFCKEDDDCVIGEGCLYRDRLNDILYNSSEAIFNERAETYGQCVGTIWDAEMYRLEKGIDTPPALTLF